MLVWHGGMRQNALAGFIPSFGVHCRTIIRRGKKTKRRKPNRPPKHVPQRIRFEELEAVQDGSKWFLPAGTKVKHGTTTNNLRQILEEGLLPGNQQGRSKLRGTIEETPLVSNGVYVASSYAAYGSSMYNFGAGFIALRKASLPLGKTITYGLRFLMAKLPLLGSSEKMNNIVRQLSLDKYVNLDKELVEACGLPVVLNFILREDVQIQADEDYVPTAKPDQYALSELVGSIWKMFGSTLILQKIPPSWIDSVEHFETGQRGKQYPFEAYLLSNEDCNPLSDTVAAFKMSELLREDAQEQALSRPRYESDRASAALAVYLCQNKPRDSRSQWFNRIVRESQSCSAFSGNCPIKEVPAFLEHLERNNKREMLASGDNLVHDFAAVSRKIGLKTNTSLL